MIHRSQHRKAMSLIHNDNNSARIRGHDITLFNSPKGSEDLVVSRFKRLIHQCRKHN